MRPAGSTRRSAAIAISSPTWCGACWRTAPTPPSSRWRRIRGADRRHPAPAAARDRRGAPRPQREHPAAARSLCDPTRRNSAGVEFGDRAGLDALLGEIRGATPRRSTAAPVVDGAVLRGRERAVVSPIDGTAARHGRRSATARSCRRQCRPPVLALRPGTATPVAERAAALERAADALERERGRLIALLQVEGGKTLDDALSEVREAVDFCRYYAAQARRALAPQALPGPTGESNTLEHRGRGVFVCISPWNFPLAIFLGQVDGGARGRQRGGRQAGRADAADRRARPCASCTGRAFRRPRCTSSPATARSAPRSSPIRASPASPSPARPKSRARSTARSPARTGRSCR